QVYLRDRLQGKTELISVSTDPVCQAARRIPNCVGDTKDRQGSTHPKITPDGRFVVFESRSTNLVPGITSGGIFLRDRQAATTEFIDVGDASPSGIGNSQFSISASGRFVAFVRRDNVYVRDRQQGTTQLISTADGEHP